MPVDLENIASVETLLESRRKRGTLQLVELLRDRRIWS